MTRLQPLTGNAFAEFIRSNRFAVIHFYAAWNAHDRVMDSLLSHQIPDGLRSRVAFANFDIDPPAHHEACLQHGVSNVPFLAFYRAGSLIRTVSGLRPPEVIAKHLQELVGPAPA